MRTGLIRAALTLLATVASFIAIYALCTYCRALPNPAILAAIIAVAISRRRSPLTRSQLLAAPAVIAATALLAAGVGTLLIALPIVGALAFTGGLFLSVWLRNFGERGRAAGALLAMPFVGMLVVPARVAAPGGPLVDLAILGAAGIVPLVLSTAIHYVARATGVEAAAEPEGSAEAPQPRERQGPSIATRMAIQMAIAIAAAFAVGFVAFRGHWGWTVLTAFIVCSGARGRGDAAYKGVLRLLGALAGTFVAAALAFAWAPTGVAEAAIVFVVLFFGLWLRDVNYAYWACCVTLILALLTRDGTTMNVTLLGERTLAIFAGALCAVAATWFVFPIRTVDVIRRRLADALAALDDVIASAHLPHSERAPGVARLEHRMTALDGVAPPVEWHRRIFAFADGPNHPARWIELTREVHRRAVPFALAETEEHARKRVRQAVGISRRAIRDHGKAEGPTVGAALLDLHDALSETHRP